MLGAIIGDLPASTYIADQTTFYERLISEDAELSDKGRLVLSAVELLNINRYAEGNEYHEFIPIDETDSWKVLMMCCVNGWWYDYPFECYVRSKFFLPEQQQDNKEFYYALTTLTKIIFYLRSGLTKAQVGQEMGKMVRDMWEADRWGYDEDVLSYIIKAWDAFYKAFDFGSALHNAMRMDGDKHLLGALTGAIAEAMYGCTYYFRKRKYTPDGQTYCSFIELPQAVNKRYEDTLRVIQEQKEWQRVFFYKNDALTNVERWYFKPVHSDICNKEFHSEQVRRITKAFHTSWDARYGIYLDDGWYYLYRSGFILARFKIKDEEKICHVEQAQDCNGIDEALNEAIQTAISPYLPMSDELKYFRFYRPEHGRKCPEHLRHKTQGKYWFGERMMGIHSNPCGFLEMGKEWLAREKDQDLYNKAKRLGPEKFGIWCYISCYYGKWCPYDSQEWMRDYLDPDYK